MTESRHPNRARVLVTVGMGPYPFDRLIEALDGLEATCDIFAQIGPSRIVPSCPHARFVSFGELGQRLHWADVIVTHAGNTVRIVQSMGKIPIAVARQLHFGEMNNDHQGTYLQSERKRGQVVALDNLADLPNAVARHREVERRLLSQRPAHHSIDPHSLACFFDSLFEPLIRSKTGRDKDP